MAKKSLQNLWHELFELSIILKAIDGVWETVSGLTVLFLSKATLDSWFFLATRAELLEDPNDKLVNFLAHALYNFSGSTQIFAAIYILLHGLLNIFLAVQLRRDRHWAYLAAIGAMLAFMSYQFYRINLYYSPVLIALTIFDVFFIVLTWHEYKYHKEIVRTKR